jgi:hypothetical protein
MFDSVWRIPSGAVWDGRAAKVGPDGSSWDGNCVAVRRAEDGMYEVADTKVDLAEQQPLRFTESELDDWARSWLARNS